jgi:DNA-directed RNA polymerase specialized sigma subunit
MCNNPVDEYLDEKSKLAAENKQLDEQLHQQWKSNPTPENLKSLYSRFEPEVNRKINLFAHGAKKVNKAGLRLSMKRNLMTAFDTWDPTKASLRTHANNMLKRSQRYVGKYQNMAFIPEEKRALITPIKAARDALQQRLGKEPTHFDIADYLNENTKLLPKRVRGSITPELIKTVDIYQIKDIPSSSFETEPSRIQPSFEKEQASLLYTALSPQEATVHDYLMGRAGKPKITSTGEIASRLGRSPSQVSRIRKKIETKFKKYTP